MAAYLTKCAGTKVTIDRVEQPSGTGFSSATSILTIRGADMPPKVVVQAAPDQQTALFEHYDIARTFRMQSALAAHQVPVADMLWLCEDIDVIGVPFYVMAHVPGKVPPDRPPYHVGGWFADALPADQATLWLAGLEAMAVLHQVTPESLPFIPTTPAEQLIPHLLATWQKFHAKLDRYGDPLLRDALLKLAATAPTVERVSAHWGDAKLGNLMFDQGRVAAILDWELCGISAPEEDVAHYFAVDWFLSTGTGNARLAGLPNVEASLQHYARHGAIDSAAMGWWFAFALVRMAIIFQRARSVVARQAPERQLRPNPLTNHLAQIVSGATWNQYQSTARGLV